jgi:hypothetical protein
VVDWYLRQSPPSAVADLVSLAPVPTGAYDATHMLDPPTGLPSTTPDRIWLLNRDGFRDPVAQWLAGRYRTVQTVRRRGIITALYVRR